MAFPTTALPVVVELFIDAAWTAITSHVYTRGDIEITYGRQNEQGQAEPSTLSLILNNRSGRYSPRNPTGIYYGKIGRNTPIRVRVTGETDPRFTGEVVAWPQQWNNAESDVWVPIEAAGVMRRMGQGGSTPMSCPGRFYPSTDPTAYWPMEDGPDAFQSFPLIGTNPFRSVGSDIPVLFGEGDIGDHLLPGALGASETSNSKMAATVSRLPHTADDWAVDLVLRAEDAGTVLEIVDRGGRTASDPAYMWTVTTTGDPDYTIQVAITVDDGTPAETILDTSGTLDAMADRQPHHLRMATVQSGTSVIWTLYVDGATVLSGTRTTTTNHGVGKIVVTTWGTGGTKASYGHVAVYHIAVGSGSSLPDVTDAADCALGSIGEPAGERIERLCTEQDIAFEGTGLDDSEGMGAQGVHGALELIRECEETDLGVLYETLDAVGLGYRTRTSLYNQAAALTLDYSDKVFASAPEPVDDDQLVRNDVTVTRQGGSSHQETLDDGALSTQDPPDGVGRYDENASISLAGDGVMLERQAGWRLHLGTVDEARYPTLHINMANRAVASDSALVAALINLRLGDRVDLTNLPSWIPPDDVSLIVMGWTETINLDGHNRELVLNCVPELPYRVAEYNAAVGGTTWKYDTEGTERAGTVINSTQTGITFTITAGPFWTTTAGEFPFDIMVGGERMTVTGIAAPSGATQLFTVTRSVNGVVKSHPVGAQVKLWKQPVYAL